jgi:hypothetical protein
MKRRYTSLSIVAAVLILAGSACAPSAPDMELTAEPAGTSVDMALPAGSTGPYQSVEILQAGISFHLPVTWQRGGPAWTWSPNGVDQPSVGMRWIDLQPPMEPEASLLPRPSQILCSQPIELPWASGRSFTVAVYGPVPEGGDAQAPVKSVETHILVVAASDGSRRAYDFYAAGTTAKQLGTVQPVLDQMLTSAKRLDVLSSSALGQQ